MSTTKIPRKLVNFDVVNVRLNESRFQKPPED